MGLQLELRQGRSFDWDLQVLNSDDSVPTGQFESTDALAAWLWQGNAEAIQANLAVSWISATNAQYSITFDTADTANLTPGVYYAEATATRSYSPIAGTVALTTGSTAVVGTSTSFESALQQFQWITFAADPTATRYQIASIASNVSLTLTAPYAGSTTASTTAMATPDTADLLPTDSTVTIIATAGTATPRPTYCAVADLRKIFPSIDDIASEPLFAGDFSDQCADSRDWIDEAVVRQYDGGNVSLLGEHGIALDAWYTGGARRTGLENRWIVQQLAANALLLRPRVVKMAAYYALSLIAESLISRDKKYQALAAQWRNQALTMLAGSTLELDINGDGYGEVPINFSSTNTLDA